MTVLPYQRVFHCASFNTYENAFRIVIDLSSIVNGNFFTWFMRSRAKFSN